MPGIAPSTLIITQPSTGTSTAHRNGLLRTKAEHIISQPTAGSIHSRPSGTVSSIRQATVNGWAWVNNAVGWGMPLAIIATAASSHRATPTSRPTTTDSSGASSSAHAALDSTVWVSDTGSDFQNRALRSRRSSYRLPRV